MPLIILNINAGLNKNFRYLKFCENSIKIALKNGSNINTRYPTILLFKGTVPIIIPSKIQNIIKYVIQIIINGNIFANIIKQSIEIVGSGDSSFSKSLLAYLNLYPVKNIASIIAKIENPIMYSLLGAEKTEYKELPINKDVIFTNATAIIPVNAKIDK